MSTIIIGGGGGHAAIDRLVAVSVHMNSKQLARGEALISQFCENIKKLCDEVEDDEVEDGDEANDDEE